MKTCPVCQKVLTDQAKFCFFCGASLLNGEAETVVSAGEPNPEPVEDPIIEQPAPEAIEVAEPVIAPEPEPVIIPDPMIEPEPEPILEPNPVIEPEPEPIFAPAPEPVVPKNEPVKPEAAAEPKPEQPVMLATDSRSLMTTVGYIFTTILFHIPLIGLIFMIAWGCGKTKNLSRKRFSLACLIMRLLYYIAILACAVFLLICFSGKFPALWNAVQPILFP